MSLSQGKIKEIEEVFNLYDTDKDGCIETSNLEQICKGLGAYIPSDDLSDFISNFKEGKINLEQFKKFFNEQYNKKINKKELIDAFTFLDIEKKGFIKADDLKHALMVIGDKLSETEADELLNRFIDKNGNIDYKKFANEISK